MKWRYLLFYLTLFLPVFIFHSCTKSVVPKKEEIAPSVNTNMYIEELSGETNKEKKLSILILPLDNKTDKINFPNSELVKTIIFRSLYSFIGFIPSLDIPDEAVLREIRFDPDNPSLIARKYNADFIIYGSYNLVKKDNEPQASVHLRIWSRISGKMNEKIFNTPTDVSIFDSIDNMIADSVKIILNEEMKTASIHFGDFKVRKEPYLLMINNKVLSVISNDSFTLSLKILSEMNYQVILKKQDDNTTALNIMVNLKPGENTNISFASLKPYNGEKTDLIVWISSDLDNTYKPLIYEFQKIYPNINVNVTAREKNKLHTLLQEIQDKGGDFPDVAYIEDTPYSKLTGGGYFENLLEYPYNAGDYKKDIAPYAWYKASFNPEILYGLPIYANPAYVYYKPDVFEKLGLRIEQLKTIDDLYEEGKKTAKSGYYLFSHVRQIFNMIILSSEQRYFNTNGKPDLKTSRIKAAFEWSKKFRDAGLDANVEDWSTEWIKMIQDGRIVYCIQGSWFLGLLQYWLAPKELGKYRIEEPPSLKKGEKQMFFNLGGTYMVIPKKSSNKPASWEFIKFMIFRDSSNSIGISSYMPSWTNISLKSLENYLGNQNLKEIWFTNALKIYPIYSTPYDSIAYSILNKALDNVLAGKKDVNKAMDDSQKELEAAIKSGKK